MSTEFAVQARSGDRNAKRTTRDSLKPLSRLDRSLRTLLSTTASPVAALHIADGSLGGHTRYFTSDAEALLP